MTSLKLDQPVEILSHEFGDQTKTGVVMGITSDFKEQDGKEIFDPIYLVEITEGKGENATVRSGNYKAVALKALEPDSVP